MPNIFGKKMEWFLETEWGPLTHEQEFFCWRYGLHGRGMRATREVYGYASETSQNAYAIRLLRKEKVLNRIRQLLDMHRKGEVDLRKGPWAHYGEKEPNFLPPARTLRLFHLLETVEDDKKLAAQRS